MYKPAASVQNAWLPFGLSPWLTWYCLVVQLEVDEVDFKEEQKRLAEEHKKAWEVDIQEKHRLEKMAEAKDTLAHDIMTRRAADFARLKVHPSPCHVHPPLRTPVNRPVT